MKNKSNIKEEIYFSLKVLVCIIIILSFWLSLIGKLHIPIETSKAEESELEYHIINYVDINKSYKVVFPTEKSIIIRLDDVQGYLWRDLTINLTDTVLSKNMSITLAVIPTRINKDIIMKKYLLNISRNNKVEIAQHGFNHTVDEFNNLSINDSYNSILSGSEIIEKILRVNPITFIPPYNTYNNNTSYVLSTLNFMILSGSRDEYSIGNNISRIGFNTETKYSNQTELIPVDDILNECKISLDNRNICVIMVHPQDYIDSNKLMNATKYNEFINLLDGIKSLHVKSITFKDLIKYTGEEIWN